MYSRTFLNGKKGELFTTLALLSLITIVFGTVIGTSTGVKSTVTKLFPRASELSCPFASTLEIRAVNGTRFSGEQFDYISDIAGGIGPGGSQHREGTITTSNGTTLASFPANFTLGGTNNFEGKDSSVNIALPAGYRIVRTFCDNISGSSCTRSRATDQNATITGITLSCNASIKYGWEVEKTSAINITPTNTQAPINTGVPGSCPAQIVNTVSIVEKGKNGEDSLITTSENGGKSFTLTNELGNTHFAPTGRYVETTSNGRIGTRPNFRATLGNVDTSLWEVDSTYCQNVSGDPVCPTNPNQSSLTMTGFFDRCGGANFGWVLRRKPIATTPSPTTQVPTGSGTAEVRLYVLQGDKAPDASFCTQVAAAGGFGQLQSAADSNGKFKSLFVTKYLATGERKAVPLTAINIADSSKSKQFSKADDGGYNNIARQTLDVGTYNFTADIPETGAQLTPVCNDLRNNIAITSGSTTPVPIIYYLTKQCRTDNSCKSEIKGVISGSGGRSRICCGAGSTPPPVGGNPGGGVKACSAARCMYSQIDTDGKERCYQGSCADGTENCTLAKDAQGNVPVNQNCTFRQDCSTPAIQLQCAGTNAGKPVAGSSRSGGTIKTTPTPVSSSLQSVSVKLSVHKSFTESSLGGFTAQVWQYSSWDNFTDVAGSNITVPTEADGARKVSDVSIPRPQSIGDYYVYDMNIVTPSTGWPTIDFEEVFRKYAISKKIKLSTSNCLLVAGPPTNTKAQGRNARGVTVTSAVCYDVRKGEVELKVDPISSDTPSTSDTQLVPVELLIHRDLFRLGGPRSGGAMGNIGFNSYKYKQWNNFTEDGPTEGPSGGEVVSSIGVSPKDGVLQGDYYKYNAAITTSTTGWPTITVDLSGIQASDAIHIQHENCLHYAYGATFGRSGAYIQYGQRHVIGCYDVKSGKVSLKLDPNIIPVGTDPLVAKYKVDSQTIAKLDRIETQVCDSTKTCETVTTRGGDIKPTTQVSFKNIQGQAIKQDSNYEIFCSLVFTDGTTSACAGKAISTKNPVATKVSSNIFGKTKVDTKTEVERADLNNDGKVTASDLAILLSNFGTARADINYDDSSDTLDLTTGFKWLGVEAR